MFEMLLFAGQQAIPYPESGPGTKILKQGNIDAGFFGEVSTVEMFKTSELSSQLGFMTGVDLIENPTWLKFAYKGKFLFIPKKPLKSYISWTTLYNAGLVYGTNDNGPFEDRIPQKGVNQLRVVIKGTDRFLVRLIRNQNTDPSNTNSSYVDSDWAGDNEWNKLFYKISLAINAADVGGKWANYSDLELDYQNKFMWAQEHTQNYTYALTRYHTAVNVYPQDKGRQDQYTAWRPVLELLPADYMLPDVGLTYSTDVTLKPLSYANVKIIRDSSDVIPLSGFIVENDFNEPAIIADARLTYLVNDAVVPVTTPTVRTDKAPVALPVSNVNYETADEDDVLRDYALIYRTTAILPVTLKAQASKSDIIPTSNIQWTILPGDVDIGDTIVRRDLDGLDWD